jgi:hypothetical protein
MQPPVEIPPRNRFGNTSRLMVTNPANSRGPLFKPSEFASLGYLGAAQRAERGPPFPSRIARSILILSTSKDSNSEQLEPLRPKGRRFSGYA